MSTFNFEQESTYQKINRFFVEQIPYLESPIIDARQNCVTVGPYRVITNGEIYEIWRSRTHLCEFQRRSWGVGYALSLYNGDSKTSDALINYDAQYSKLDHDRWVYTHHIKSCQRRNEYTRKAMLQSRLSRVDSELFELDQRVSSILKNIHIG